jgi:hypothetical protein
MAPWLRVTPGYFKGIVQGIMRATCANGGRRP